MALFHTTVLDNQIKALPTVDTASGSIATFDTDLTENLIEVKCQIVAQSYDSLTISQNDGLNWWGGVKMLQDFINANITGFAYDSTTLTFSASWDLNDKVILKMPFKVNTRYTFVIVGTNTGTSVYSNLSVVYTDGTSQQLNWSEATANTKKTLVFTTTANKTVDYVKGIYASAQTILYYNECGMFEGVATIDDFTPYNGISINIPFGETLSGGGSFDVLSGILTRSDDTTKQLSANYIQALNGTNNVWCDTGDTEVKYLLTVGKKIS